jgi:uncharacterized membrane protein
VSVQIEQVTKSIGPVAQGFLTATLNILVTFGLALFIFFFMISTALALPTPLQEVAYAVNQLVEMAVRAMSPAINDPFTAMTCLNYIGEGLALFIKQGEKNSCY